jgi:hypothetical protein
VGCVGRGLEGMGLTRTRGVLKLMFSKRMSRLARKPMEMRLRMRATTRLGMSLGMLRVVMLAIVTVIILVFGFGRVCADNEPSLPSESEKRGILISLPCSSCQHIMVLKAQPTATSRDLLQISQGLICCRLCPRSVLCTNRSTPVVSIFIRGPS